ncbi:unnamed protein product, partial [Prorocentrum cordatum]
SRPGTAGSREAELPPAPRAAWAEGPEVELEGGPAARFGRPGGDDDDSEVAELARQIRRDMLARRLAEEEGDAPPEPDASGAPAADPAGHPGRWALRTEEARRSLAALQAGLDEASARAEEQRRQLGEYVSELRSRPFAAEEAPPAEQSPPAPGATPTAPPAAAGEPAEGGEAPQPEEERLVSMPADFDDVVDLNAHHAAQRRRHQSRGGPAGAAGALQVAEAAEAGSSATLNLPSFLEKYFFEEQAVEQLPHMRLRHEEEKQKGGTDSALERGLRQIARLDGLLAKREADAQARLEVAKVDFGAACERLQRQREDVERDKIEKLRRLKERGLIPSRGASRATSAQASEAGSPASRRGLQVAVPAPGGEPAADPMWSSWTCSGAPAEAPASAEPSRGGGSAGAGGADEGGVEEPDTSTFSLTSVGGALPTEQARRREAPAAAAEHPAPRGSGLDARAGVQLARVEEEPPPGAGEDAELDLCAAPAEDDDPFEPDEGSWEKLRRIDEQLQKLIPERDWEAKSIASLPPLGSERGGRSRSAWSRSGLGGPAPSVADDALPGDPALRQQMELRSAEMALQSIDSRLEELRSNEAASSVLALPPDPEQLHRLLLQAQIEAGASDEGGGMLALDAQAAGGAAAVAEGAQLALVAGPPRSLPDSAPLRQARTLLGVLSGAQGSEADDAFLEAESALALLQHDAAELEAPKEAILPPEGEPFGPATDLAPLAARLEEMAREARHLSEAEAPGEGLLPRLREDLELEAAEEAARAQARLRSLPTLSSATEPAEADDDDDLLSLASGVGDPDAVDDDGEGVAAAPAEAPPAAAAPGWAPAEASGPSEALRAALQIELPGGDGLWDDAE